MVQPYGSEQFNVSAQDVQLLTVLSWRSRFIFKFPTQNCNCIKRDIRNRTGTRWPLAHLPLMLYLVIFLHYKSTPKGAFLNYCLLESFLFCESFVFFSAKYFSMLLLYVLLLSQQASLLNSVGLIILLLFFSSFTFKHLLILLHHINRSYHILFNHMCK